MSSYSRKYMALYVHFSCSIPVRWRVLVNWSYYEDKADSFCGKYLATKECLWWEKEAEENEGNANHHIKWKCAFCYCCCTLHIFLDHTATTQYNEDPFVDSLMVTTNKFTSLSLFRKKTLMIKVNQ